eukprot:3368634-Ditylum_brightwellii.AAC.1
MFFDESSNSIIDVARDVVGEKEDFCNGAESSHKMSLELPFQEGELQLHSAKNLALESLACSLVVIGEALDLLALMIGLSLELKVFEAQVIQE